jgi:hypothetical protein
MASFLRSLAALFAGLVVMFVMVIGCTRFAVWLLHLKSGHPAPGYLALNVAYSLLAATAGGWVTARLAPRRPLLHGVVLAGIVLLLGVLSYHGYHGGQPGWYQALMLIAPFGCNIGGAYVYRVQQARRLATS